MPTALATGRRRPVGLFLLPVALLVLLAGLWGGLSRLGYRLPAASTSADAHGVLMSLGFLGTLIAIERATALAARWAWAVPAVSVLGSLWLVAGGPAHVGQALLACAGAGLVVVYVALDRVQRSVHNTLMGVAATGWVVAALLWLAGRDVSRLVPWLAVFLVVTITAERLELSRLTMVSAAARGLLVAGVLVLVGGAVVSVWAADAGQRVAGGALLAIAVWLVRYDLARRTVRQRGVTRFMAAGLLTGYGWLAVAGALWLAGGYQVDNAAYDAQLHAVFLGFVMSMVFAHAPVIAPAVIRRPLPYRSYFYGPLVLLHASLLLRLIGGDAAGSNTCWQLGGVLNVVALLAFVAVTAATVVLATANRRSAKAARTSQPQPAAAPARRPAISSPTVAGAVLGVVVLVAAVAFADSGRSPVASSAVSVDAADATSGVAVSLVEMRIVPAAITVPAGTHLMLKVTDNGSMRHDLRLSNGAHTPLLEPGQTVVLDAGVVTTALSGWCTVPGHREAGMSMRIDVGAAAAASSPAAGSGGGNGMSGMSGMGSSSGAAAGSSSGADAVSKDLSAPAPAGWQPVDAALPAVGAGSVHDVTWHIENVTRSVAPGVTQQLWTFNGSVPGPVLHGHVGDTFNVTVVNDTDMTHNVDFHAESGPPASAMTPIPPGSTHTYHFVATHAGAWLYHCGTEPMLLHMANGMYGAVIIDPPGLAPAAQQYVLVGSEMFFGPQGQIGDYTKMLADKPDTVVFNGYPFAYQRVPLPAKVGELVRIWVIDAGPNRSLSFHVVGAPFTSLYLDGHYELDAANAADGAAQTLPVDPGDGGFVELRFDQNGSYPFLTHDMADATLGASGSFAVGN